MIDNDAALDAEIVRLETDGAAILDAVHDFLGRFICYPSEAAHVAHTLWCAHTHLMDAWAETPRVAFLSPEPGSGKSRAMEITALLVPRPVFSVNVSPAYLFRKISDEAGPPTMLMDEIDTVFGAKAKDNEDLRGLLNAGYRRGAVAGRCECRGKAVETVDYPAYCAVAMAGLGRLPDTILTRSVVVRMRRRAPNEHVQPYRHRRDANEGLALGRRLRSWSQSIKSRVAEIVDAFPELPEVIVDRDADVWEPLVAVADAAGGKWPELARVTAVTLVTQSREAGRDVSLGIRLLADLREVFGDADRRPTSYLTTALQNLPEAPWSDLKGKALDARKLANLLGDYGVSSKTIRISDSTAKGYLREDLTDVWDRYLPPAADPEESVTDVTNVTMDGADPFAGLKDSKYKLS